MENNQPAVNAKPGNQPIAAPSSQSNPRAGNLQRDERTTVISSAPPAQQNVPKPEQVTEKNAGTNPFSELMNEQDKKVQKKRILSGVIAGGSLLGGALLVSSFLSKSKDVPVADNTLQPGENNNANTTEPEKEKPVVVATGHKVSDIPTDDLSLHNAREVAKADIGEGLFKHQGIIYSTKTDEEWQAMSDQEKADYLKEIFVNDNEKSGDEIKIGDRDFGLVHPLLTEVEDMKVLRENATGDIYYADTQNNLHHLENVTQNEYGDLIRTDPETGEITQFNPSMILDHVNEGKIDISVYPSDVDIVNEQHPIEQATWLTTSDEGLNEPYTTVTSGWDIDGDGAVDKVEQVIHEYPDGSVVLCDNQGNELPDTPGPIYEDPAEPIPMHEGTKGDAPANDPSSVQTASTNAVPSADEASERDILDERIRAAAEEAGISDIHKIKIHETEDGYDVKVKGDEGEKLKVHFDHQDLQQYGESGASEEHRQGLEEGTPAPGNDDTNDQGQDQDLSPDNHNPDLYYASEHSMDHTTYPAPETGNFEGQWPGLTDQS